MATFATFRRTPPENPIPPLASLSIQQQMQPTSPQWILLPESLTVSSEALGNTASSATYRGTFERHYVAVRKLTPDTSWQTVAEIVQRSQNLQNPHLLQIYGVSHQSVQPPCMVYPLFEEGNVVQYLGKVPDAVRARLVYEASLGMEYLHSMNVVHGRLKPSNILVSSEGRAYVTDYGLYQLGNLPASSPRYFSPEAWKGRTSKPSDVFAFAMTAYEIFTSTQPWGFLSDSQIFQLMVREGERPDRPDPTEPLAILDRDWEILQEGWANEPSARPTFTQICVKISTPDPIIPLPQANAEEPMATTPPPQRLPLTLRTTFESPSSFQPISPAPPPYASPSPRPLPTIGRFQSPTGSSSTSHSRPSLPSATRVDVGEIHQPTATLPQGVNVQKLVVSNGGLPSPSSDGRSSAGNDQIPGPTQTVTRQTRALTMPTHSGSMSAMELPNSATTTLFGFGETIRSSPPTTTQFGLLSPRTSYSTDQNHFRSLTSPSIRRAFDPPSQRTSMALSPRPQYSEWSGPTAPLALGGGIPERAES
ncbi:hypothetical protein FRB90_007869, partial [Tulasnella sp. 427]